MAACAQELQVAELVAAAVAERDAVVDLEAAVGAAADAGAVAFVHAPADLAPLPSVRHLPPLELGADDAGVHWQSWHELQAWLADRAEHRVMVPFIAALAELMPNGATRLRRDFVSLLCLLRAHALLHQANRGRDAHGRVEATIDDYRVIRELAGDLLAEGADAGVTSAIRDTVETTRQLLEEAPAGMQHVTVRAIGDRLTVGMPATYDRVRRALFAGYLIDVASASERTKRIVLGAELPGDSSEYLPPPEQLLERHLGSVSEPASEDADALVERDSVIASDARTCRTEPRVDAA